MQKKLFLFSLVLIGLMFVQVGCTTYSYTSRSTGVNQRAINSTQATADIDINYQKKVTATSDFQKFQGQAKQEAVYRCILNSGIDVLIDPIFQVEHRPITGYRATVTGFAGMYKKGLNALDEVVAKKYTKEDIDKYLLLTDPSYYQYYYQKEGKSGNVYNIKCATAPAAAKPALPAVGNSKKAAGKKPVSKEKAYLKAKQMRDAGIGLTCTGFFSWLGIPLWAAGAKKMQQYQ